MHQIILSIALCFAFLIGCVTFHQALTNLTFLIQVQPNQPQDSASAALIPDNGNEAREVPLPYTEVTQGSLFQNKARWLNQC